jgi:AraC-like DNA-binding protein
MTADGRVVSDSGAQENVPVAATGTAHVSDAQVGGPISESVAARPAAQLRPFVAHYTGYRQKGVPPARHAGLPSPYLTMIFTLDEPLHVAEHPDPAQPGGDFVTLAGGLHSVPAVITHDGYQSGIQLALNPLGARAFFGFPAGELAGIDAEASAVCGSLATEIHERIQAATSWADRFVVLEEVLARRLADRQPKGRAEVIPEVGFAWRRLVSTGGTIGVSALAGETGWSDRHLRTRFNAEFGISPKTAARVVRFDRARRLLQRRAASGRRLDLAALAVYCGYYDQAHLDAEFRVLAGASPTTWLAREFRNLQSSAVTLAEP